MYDIVKTYPRPDQALLDEFKTVQSASIHEVMGKTGTFDPDFRPIWRGIECCGSALTVLTRPGDNLMVHVAVSRAQPGDVLVVDCGEYTKTGGMWGEILSIAAMQKGVVGLVINGSVRDTIPNKELGFPIFSRGISMIGTTKMCPGTINHPILIGGVLVNPGDIIRADDDGIVVIPLSKVREVLKAAKEREQKEAGVIERLKQGETTLDILGFRKNFEALNLTVEP